MEWTRGHTLGRGCSGTVSIATANKSGEIFAVKSVELSLYKFWQRETKILSSLSSPQIVGYKGQDITMESNKLMYNLFMEYMPRGSLTDLIHERGGRLDESMIGYYISQIVQGLEYLHSSGIVHCDIKGRNILIGQSGAKIADLGCAKWVNPVGGTGDHEAAGVPIGGTPMFMAPEVARGEEQGYPADIWALGCTIIEMATGGSPWPNVTNPVSVLYRIAFSGESPEIPEFLSDQAKDFLNLCLRRDPKERWTAKQLLKHPFIEDLNPHEKQSQNFDTSSPTSVLDQGFWNSMEESETLGDIVQKNSSNSPVDRIRRLSLNPRVSNRTWGENWITEEEEEEEESLAIGLIFFQRK
ncbi:unnamed protein product [Ilex paraguariensis]|uniref:mitogen-activated protein kinase kinase kinase n=1 Tax=Ilex paraguariensis TaxID=185542 RepID=A0ABC8UD19_9AQUA